MTVSRLLHPMYKKLVGNRERWMVAAQKSYPVMKQTKLVSRREVREISVENDGFSDDLCPEYLKLLGRSISTDVSGSNNDLINVD